MALSADRLVNFSIVQERCNYGVAASQHVYRHGFAGLDPAGYAKPFVPGDVFMGIFEEEKDNSTGANAGKSVNVYNVKDFEHAFSAIAAKDVGAPVYATADDTLALSGHPDAFVGYLLRYISATKGLVRMRRPFEKPPAGVGNVDIDVDFARAKFANADESAVTYPVPGLMFTGVGAGLTAGTTGLLRDETTGELKLLIDNDNEVESLNILTPQVFNVTKGITAYLEGRVSVAGNNTDDWSFGLYGLAGGMTSTEMANTAAATAGAIAAFWGWDTDDLNLDCYSDDNATVVGPTDSTIDGILATNKRMLVIIRPTGVCEFWVNEARVLSTTVFSVGAVATPLMQGFLNLEKSGGAGVAESRARRIRVAGAIA